MTDVEQPRARRRATAAARASKPESLPAPPAGDVVEPLDVETLHGEGGRVGEAMSKALTVQRGAVGRATADSIVIRQGALGGARADRVDVQMGAIGGAVANTVNVRQGFIQGVVARNVQLEQAGARMVVANRVSMGPQSGAMLVVAASVDGGRTLVDWRGAIALGAAFAIVTAFLRRRMGG